MLRPFRATITVVLHPRALPWDGLWLPLPGNAVKHFGAEKSANFARSRSRKTSGAHRKTPNSSESGYKKCFTALPEGAKHRSPGHSEAASAGSAALGYENHPLRVAIARRTSRSTRSTKNRTSPPQNAKFAPPLFGDRYHRDPNLETFVTVGWAESLSSWVGGDR